MESRKVLFTSTDKTTTKMILSLPGNALNPPKHLQFKNKLYEYTGSGLGGDVPVNFYREFDTVFSVD